MVRVQCEPFWARFAVKFPRGSALCDELVRLVVRCSRLSRCKGVESSACWFRAALAMLFCAFPECTNQDQSRQYDSRRECSTVPVRVSV